MILRRLGNKSAIAKDIQKYFPAHDIYIEPFFGAGGMFFNKPKAKYNFLNDIDSDVYNCFNVLMRHKEELREYIENIPYHQDFWNECKTRVPDNDIEKAVYFLVLSNFGYMGMPETLHLTMVNNKSTLLSNLQATYEILSKNENRFTNCDFREVIKKISFKTENDKANTLIYCDPPYLNTSDNYSHSFTEVDSNDLFDTLQNSGCKWAMSEFDNPFILEQAKQRKLNVHIIGERQNMKNRRKEILITNYAHQKSLFD